MAIYVGLARGYKGAKLLIQDAATLQQAKLGNKPAVHIHEYSKLGIDIRVDDASLYRLGRKLLPTIAVSDAAPAPQPCKAVTSHPLILPSKEAPKPTPEIDPPDSPFEQASASITPSDEGGAEVGDNHHQKATTTSVKVARPRKEYIKQRPDGSQWSTRQSSRVESALISHATESDITGYKPSSKGMGAYFSTEETVTTMQLGDIPESEWFNDEYYALLHHDEDGRLRVWSDQRSSGTRTWFEWTSLVWTLSQ